MCPDRPKTAGRQKFEIYVCTAADRQYALEVRFLNLFVLVTELVLGRHMDETHALL